MKNISVGSPLKKIAGVVLIVFGFTLHIIPLFPAGWIIVVGFELLGVHLILQDRIKDWFKKFFKKTK